MEGKQKVVDDEEEAGGGSKEKTQEVVVDGEVGAGGEGEAGGIRWRAGRGW